MEIGSEMFSMALALKLQKATPPTPDVASLRLAEPMIRGSYNTDWDTSSDVSFTCPFYSVFCTISRTELMRKKWK